ncbi:S8 family serine peptidase [Actinosynnema pretiosum subsp. pretiosum]|uniref:S8 family serine peptidase n=1 Tax=Actinosynnema pretiosum subsp. pretiosum TaxID=103721 RepID=A0AA45R6X4_9PSEU|nr:secreted subtilisin-like protease [Actinosynnema pretiosum subsp. pretiosum]QUF07143.1 S8 family serine peptidase [Actinosynnema pretiosum subsp. pretiosum]
MPLLRRARAAAVSAALLATGLAAAPSASASAHTADGAGQAGPTAPGCVQTGRELRYLVVFDRGTSEPLASAEVGAACGRVETYHPQIAVAVATSTDPGFGTRMGDDRAYSAQAEATSRTKRKPDETAQLKSAVPETGDLTAQQWDMELVNAAAAHAVSTGSRDVVVGVLDSGVDPDHPDLAGALDPALSAGCTSGVADPARASWSPTTSPHGTHVAGTIAAADDGRGTTGVAPGVRIASVKVVDDDGFIYPEYAVCGFMWAAARGMAVTNNSYYIDPWVFTCRDQGGQSVVQEAVRRAVDYAADRGVLSVAAAGNEGADLTRPGRDALSPTNAAAKPRPVDSSCLVLPAQLRNVVAVSSVGSSKVKAGYSSYGLGAVDLTGPGGDRKQPADDGVPGCVLSTVPSGYDYSCGTSMAVPHVSGVAALLASGHPEASPAELTKMLGEQAETLPCPADYDLNGTGAQDGYCTGYSEYNGFYGHGLVDAEAAVKSPLTGVGGPVGDVPWQTGAGQAGSGSGSGSGSGQGGSGQGGSGQAEAGESGPVRTGGSGDRTEAGGAGTGSGTGKAATIG